MIICVYGCTNRDLRGVPEIEEAKLVSLKWVFDLDNSIAVLRDMPCGYYAERKTQNDDWVIRKR